MFIYVLFCFTSTFFFCSILFSFSCLSSFSFLYLFTILIQRRFIFLFHLLPLLFFSVSVYYILIHFTFLFLLVSVFLFSFSKILLKREEVIFFAIKREGIFKKSRGYPITYFYDNEPFSVLSFTEWMVTCVLLIYAIRGQKGQEWLGWGRGLNILYSMKYLIHLAKLDSVSCSNSSCLAFFAGPDSGKKQRQAFSGEACNRTRTCPHTRKSV